MKSKFVQVVAVVAVGTLVFGALSRFTILLLSLSRPLSLWSAPIQAIAGAWLNGQAIYPVSGNGEFYGDIYGPLLYQIVGVSQLVFGIGMPLAGLPMVLAEVGAVIVTALTIRRSGVSRKACAAAVGLMVVELGAANLEGVRADQVLVLLASLALALLPAFKQHPGRSSFWIGLCGGLAVALKFTGVVYILPAFLPMWAQAGPDRRRALLGVATGSILGAGFPYLVPGVDMAAHFAQIQGVNGLGPRLAPFGHSLLFAVEVLLPVLVWMPLRRSAAQWKELMWIVIPLALTMIPASKAGGGPWHLAPFLPALAIYGARGFEQSVSIDGRRLALVCVLVAIVALQARQQLVPAIYPRDRELRQAGAEIDAFLAVHGKDVVALGSTWAGPRAAVDLGAFQAEVPRYQQPLLFVEQNWVWTGRGSTAKIEALINQLIRPCKVRYWLNAPGEPFRAAYYDSRIAREFLERYHLISSSDYLAIWECRERRDSF